MSADVTVFQPRAVVLKERREKIGEEEKKKEERERKNFAFPHSFRSAAESWQTQRSHRRAAV